MRDRIPRTVRSPLWIAAVVVGLILVLFGFRGRKPSSASPIASSRAEVRVPVTVTSVTQRDMAAVVRAAGSVHAVQSVKVSAKTPGKVLAVHAQEGDRVAAGQVLVDLDTSDVSAQVLQAQGALQISRARLAQAEDGASLVRETSAQQFRQAQMGVDVASAQLQVARANETAARATFTRAQSDYARIQALFREGAVAAQQVDATQAAVATAQAQHHAAQAQVLAAESQLKIARAAVEIARANDHQVAIRDQEIESARGAVNQAQAVVQLAQLQFKNMAIRAPITGVLTQRSVEPGEVVSTGAILLVVADISQVEVALSVSDTDIARVHRGLAVTISVDSFREQTFQGVVVSTSETADPRTRMFLVRVVLPNANMALRPGMFGRGVVVTNTFLAAASVPQEAVLYERDQAYVFVVGADEVARRRPVKIGVSDAGYVQVSGLEAGTHVIVQGQNLVRDGTLVKTLP